VTSSWSFIRQHYTLTATHIDNCDEERLGRNKVHDVSWMGSTKRCKIFYIFFYLGGES